MDILMHGTNIIQDLYVLEVNFPFAYLESAARYRAGTFLYFPGHSNIDSPAVTFYETESFQLLQAFKSWQDKIRDNDGNYGMPVDYLGTVVLHLHDTRGQERARCYLYGCWPSRLADWAMNYQNSTHLQVQVTFACNDSEFIFNDATAAGVNQALAQLQPEINRLAEGNFTF